MIIYATMVVKNEGDILGDTIKLALSWADRIFVIDNSSEDSSPEILKQFGSRVELLATFHGEFQEGLKSIAFNWVNANLSYPRADWWCVMDADEIYYQDPRAFLRSVPIRFGRVCTNTIEFIGLADANHPLRPESYSQYIPLNWSESRFYRNTRSLTWANYKDNGPKHIGATYHRRIEVLHFPFRTEDQIKKRIETRKKNQSVSGIAWSNSNFGDEKDLLVNYKIDRRRSNNGSLEFSCSAENFLRSSRDKISWVVKQIAFVCGLYR